MQSKSGHIDRSKKVNNSSFALFSSGFSDGISFDINNSSTTSYCCLNVIIFSNIFIPMYKLTYWNYSVKRAKTFKLEDRLFSLSSTSSPVVRCSCNHFLSTSVSSLGLLFEIHTCCSSAPSMESSFDAKKETDHLSFPGNADPL